MGESVDFIKDRAVKTISAANQIAGTWVWQEKPIAAMQADLTAIMGDPAALPPIIGQEDLMSQAEAAMLAARGQWDTQLDLLHRRTVQGVGMAKSRHRNNPANLAVLAPLTANSNSRSETLKEALAWESAWALLDPAWSPLPANTLAAFKPLRKQCAETLQQAYTDAHTDWRKEAEKLADMARDVEDVNQAWYADVHEGFPRRHARRRHDPQHRAHHLLARRATTAGSHPARAGTVEVAQNFGETSQAICL